MTYQEVTAGNTALFIFALCVLFRFLALAAQNENWSLPLAVIHGHGWDLFCEDSTTISSPRSDSLCSSGWHVKMQSRLWSLPGSRCCPAKGGSRLRQKLPVAFATHPHDLVCFHSWCLAVSDRSRGQGPKWIRPWVQRSLLE